jgi:TetR/AcrR family transcriptional repressor of nem operon
MPRPRKFDEHEVLDACIDTFVQNGYTGTSMSMIMEVSGLQKGSIYAAFKSKETLFLKCLERYMELNYKKMRKKLDDEVPPMDAIESYIYDQILPQAGEKRQAQGSLIVNTMIENEPAIPELQVLLLTINQRLSDAMANVVRQAQGEGHIRIDMDAEDIANQIQIFICGMQPYLRCGLPETDIKDKTRLFLTQLLRPY